MLIAIKYKKNENTNVSKNEQKLPIFSNNV